MAQKLASGGPPERPRPALRIVSSDNDPPSSNSGTLSGDSTLPEVYELGFKPLWLAPHQADAKTYQCYEEALDHWVPLTRLPGGREPGVAEIDDYVSAAYVTGLGKLPGNRSDEVMSIGTIRKHCRSINKLLAFAGPKRRDRHNYKNLCLVAEPPLVIGPSADLAAPDGDFTIEEVRAMWIAAARMLCPRLPNVRPVDWWRGILVVAPYTGLRRGQLLGLAYGDLEARYITIRPRRSKRRQGKRQYLPAEAIEAIERIRTPRERIFAWPHVLRHLDSQLRRLAQLADIPPQRRFGWNGFRKLAGTQAFEIAGPAGSQAVLGHSRDGTAMAHYINGNAQARRAAAVIDQMPSPKPMPQSGEHQPLLFQ